MDHLIKVCVRCVVVVAAVALFGIASTAAAATSTKPPTNTVHARALAPQLAALSVASTAPFTPAMGKAIATSVNGDTPPQMKVQPGDVTDPALARLLLNSQSAGISLVAVGTDRGSVCMHAAFVSHETFAGCLEKFEPSGFDMNIHGGAGQPTTVFGLLPNDVTHVTIQTADGSSYNAVIGSNAYAWSSRQEVPVSVTAYFLGNVSASMPIEQYSYVSDPDGTLHVMPVHKIVKENEDRVRPRSIPSNTFYNRGIGPAWAGIYYQGYMPATSTVLTPNKDQRSYNKGFHDGGALTEVDYWTCHVVSQCSPPAQYAQGYTSPQVLGSSSVFLYYAGCANLDQLFVHYMTCKTTHP